jgi:hypothetical protein
MALQADQEEISRADRSEADGLLPDGSTGAVDEGEEHLLIVVGVKPDGYVAESAIGSGSGTSGYSSPPSMAIAKACSNLPINGRAASKPIRVRRPVV